LATALAFAMPLVSFEVTPLTPLTCVAVVTCCCTASTIEGKRFADGIGACGKTNHRVLNENVGLVCVCVPSLSGQMIDRFHE
jgi:hypothetical protein